MRIFLVGLAMSLFGSTPSKAVTPEPPPLPVAKTDSSASESEKMPIVLKKLRDLTLEAPVSAGGGPFVSAASGLFQVHGSLFTVMDDEHHLGIFPPPPSEKEGALYRVFEGDLPSDPKERKKAKPDLESLTFLGTEWIQPAGALLAVPSGSKKNRVRGTFLAFEKGGALPAQPQEVSFQSLYQHLLKRFSELNIEGAAVLGQTLKLFQRGNGASAQNATIDLDLPGVIDDLKKGKDLSPTRILRIQEHQLGRLQGVQLSFTDAFSSPALGTWFLAAAEATEDTYLDGKFAGAILGKLNSQGEVIYTQELASPFKPEGLWIDDQSSPPSFYVVTDADDPSQAASLYVGTIPPEGLAAH